MLLCVSALIMNTVWCLFVGMYDTLAAVTVSTHGCCCQVLLRGQASAGTVACLTGAASLCLQLRGRKGGATGRQRS